MKNNVHILFSGLLFLVLSSLFMQSCNQPPNDNSPKFITTQYKFPAPRYFPTVLNIPSDNLTTVEGVKLGRYLYYDGRISGRTDPDSFMSCATCHIQSNSFECGTSKFSDGFPIGATGIKAPHVMLPHINLVYNYNYAWDGSINIDNHTLGSAGWGVPQKPQFSFDNLESLFWIVLYLPYEMNSDTLRSMTALKSIKNPNYPAMYKAAFGTEEINMERTGKAIAQFVRTLISYNSKFDKYIRKEPGGNLTPSELRGYQLFISEPADCFHCHGPYPLMTTNLFYNNAKDSYFPNPNDSRFGYTHDSVDIGAFKATTLRNIEVTGPYMHDGRFKTLEEVVNFYSSGLKVSPYVSPLMKHLNTGGAQLSDQQKIDLIAYLKTLTDNQFLTDSTFAKPADLKY
jgi:cytochrome c peroxidase